MKYRAEIDGLRAWAVLPVILFHAGFGLFKGGYVGVDIFFVISGYLITTILVDDIEKERFSIAHFYERRARRILPALTLVVLACVPAAWALMLPGQLDDFAQSIVAASLFVSNILFWMEADYFDTAVEEKPLLHTGTILSKAPSFPANGSTKWTGSLFEEIRRAGAGVAGWFGEAGQARYNRSLSR
ncbi:acyltransferase [Alteriqipengyuania flavescens]|uniref:acyltransferase family protein n=1 Tax=Alteriqipengyuania flavescens TaxID=3053610 RepID=UPI0025B47832|nr:acyltransferase [Alteriqipengyuania flavescens]WJY18916.1 acyltransferase [Alteriqipengyuania flavescens]WJY24856.1 acyltransferase [Alteriqipengyuania flavescens]